MSDDGRELRIVRGAAGLKAIAADWTEVAGRLTNRGFYHLPGWYEAYLDALEPDPESVVFCVVYQDGRAAGVFPFRQTTRRSHGLSVRTLELPRHEHMHLSDFVVPEADRSPELMRWLLRRLRSRDGLKWDVMCLRKVPEGSAAAALTAAAHGLRSASHVTTTCKYTPVAGTYDELLKQLTKKFRANLRNARNRLEKVGDIAFETAIAPDELERAYPAFLDVEASGWKGGAGTATAIRWDPRLTDFYRRAMSFGAGGDRCEIHLLRVGARPIAASYSVVAGDTCFVLKVAYDEEFSYVSPAHMLLDRMVRQQVESGRIRTVNWVSGVEWVSVWSTARCDVRTVFVFNRTPVGMAVRLGSELSRAAARILPRARASAPRLTPVDAAVPTSPAADAESGSP